MPNPEISGDRETPFQKPVGQAPPQSRDQESEGCHAPLWSRGLAPPLQAGFLDTGVDGTMLTGSSLDGHPEARGHRPSRAHGQACPSPGPHSLALLPDPAPPPCGRGSALCYLPACSHLGLHLQSGHSHLPAPVGKGLPRTFTTETQQPLPSASPCTGTAM